MSHDDPMHSPTHTAFINAYLAHLRHRRYSPRTIDVYGSILYRADQALHGLMTAEAHHIDAWLGSDAWQPKTHSLYLSAVRGIFRWAHQRGLIDHDTGADLTTPKIPARLPHAPTTAQVHTILACVPQPVWLWSLIAARSGARAIEISRLAREHITERALRLDGKGGKERFVPTHPDIWAAVCDLPPGPITTRTERYISRRAWDAYRAAGVAIGIHKLRSYFATELIEAGVDIQTVRVLLGHTSLASTQVYVGVSEARMRAAITALPSWEAAAGSAPAAVPTAPAACPPG